MTADRSLSLVRQSPAYLLTMLNAGNLALGTYFTAYQSVFLLGYPALALYIASGFALAQFFTGCLRYYPSIQEIFAPRAPAQKIPEPQAHAPQKIEPTQGASVPTRDIAPWHLYAYFRYRRMYLQSPTVVQLQTSGFLPKTGVADVYLDLIYEKEAASLTAFNEQQSQSYVFYDGAPGLRALWRSLELKYKSKIPLSTFFSCLRGLLILGTVTTLGLCALYNGRLLVHWLSLIPGTPLYTLAYAIPLLAALGAAYAFISKMITPMVQSMSRSVDLHGWKGALKGVFYRPEGSDPGQEPSLEGSEADSNPKHAGRVPTRKLVAMSTGLITMGVAANLFAWTALKDFWITTLATLGLPSVAAYASAYVLFMGSVITYTLFYGDILYKAMQPGKYAPSLQDGMTLERQAPSLDLMPEKTEAPSKAFRVLCFSSNSLALLSAIWGPLYGSLACGLGRGITLFAVASALLGQLAFYLPQAIQSLTPEAKRDNSLSSKA